MAQGYVYVPMNNKLVKVNQQTGEEYVLIELGGAHMWHKIPSIPEQRIEVPQLDLSGGRLIGK